MYTFMPAKTKFKLKNKQDFTKDLAKKIVQIAKEKYSSQKKLADAININETTISRWIKGENIPDLYTLYKISVLADISLDWLILDKNITNDVNYYDFSKIIIEAYLWGKENEVKSFDSESYLTSVYMTYKAKQKEDPHLNFDNFLEIYGHHYKMIQFD